MWRPALALLPARMGVAMDVPDTIRNWALSFFPLAVHAPSRFTPGARMSGFRMSLDSLNREPRSFLGLTGGPREENSATYGASSPKLVWAAEMDTVGLQEGSIRMEW